MTTLRSLLVLCLIASLTGSVRAESKKAPAKTKPVRPVIFDYRQFRSPDQWRQDRTIKLKVGQEFSVRLPPQTLRPTHWLVSREVLSHAGYQHVLPVIAREGKRLDRITWRALHPGREVISVFHLADGGVPVRTAFCVFRIEVSPVDETAQRQLTAAQVQGHPDLLKLTQLRATSFDFGKQLSDLYTFKLYAEDVTPERRVAVVAAIRTLGPEIHKWFETSPREPLYVQRRAAGLTGNDDLRKHFETQLTKLSPSRQASAFNSTLLAYAQLGGEAAVPKIAPFSDPASGARSNFVDEALRLATWNRFLKDAAPTVPFHGNHGGPNSLFEDWKKWWVAKGSKIKWAAK